MHNYKIAAYKHFYSRK